MTCLQALLDKKLVLLLNVFLNNKEDYFHLQKLAKTSKVPLSTCHRLIKLLVKAKVIQTIPIGKLNVYTLTKDNNIINLLEVMLK